MYLLSLPSAKACSVGQKRSTKQMQGALTLQLGHCLQEGTEWAQQGLLGAGTPAT